MLNHLGFFFFFFFLRLGLGQRRAVVIIGRWLLPSLVDMGDICCHYWQHILVLCLISFLFFFLVNYYFKPTLSPPSAQTVLLLSSPVPLSIHIYVHPSTLLSFHPSVLLSVRLSLHLSVHSSTSVVTALCRPPCIILEFNFCQRPSSPVGLAVGCLCTIRSLSFINLSPGSAAYTMECCYNAVQ